MRKMQVPSRGQEDPLEEGMATRSSILAWEIHPMDRGAWWDVVHGVKKELDTTEQLNNGSSNGCRYRLMDNYLILGATI